MCGVRTLGHTCAHARAGVGHLMVFNVRYEN